MNKMPRIWIEYCDFAVRTARVTQTRRIFDRALRSLPVTQHRRIWPLYLDFVTKKHRIPETAVRVYKRYLKVSEQTAKYYYSSVYRNSCNYNILSQQLCPEDAENFIEYLLEVNQLDEAAVRLAQLVNNENFISRKVNFTLICYMLTLVSHLVFCILRLGQV